MSRQSAAEKIIRRLPDTFTRQDVLEEAKNLNYSYSTASAACEKMVYMNLAERIETGKYRKLDTTFEPEI